MSVERLTIHSLMNKTLSLVTPARTLGVDGPLAWKVIDFAHGMLTVQSVSCVKRKRHDVAWPDVHSAIKAGLLEVSE